MSGRIVRRGHHRDNLAAQKGGDLLFFAKGAALVVIRWVFLDAEFIASTDLFTLPDAKPFHFGILTSTMHMAWMRQVCGRMKSDYRYSAALVYNNFPWPEGATDKQRTLVEAKAQAVLDARAKYLAPVAADVSPLKPLPTAPNQKSEPTHVGCHENKACTLADLYDPLAMPLELVKSHAELDRAVEKCYRPEPFHSDREWVEYLFAFYEKLSVPLLPATPQGQRQAPLMASRP